jgi:hypothetical protein
MNSIDEANRIRKKIKVARERLNDAIKQLEQLGIDEATAKKYCEQGFPVYVKKLRRALEKYIEAKRELE